MYKGSSRIIPFRERSGVAFCADSLNHRITEQRDTLGRSTGYTYVKNDIPQQQTTIDYGADGRVDTTGFTHQGGHKDFIYSYLPGTHLLHTLTHPNGLTLTQSYEPQRDLPTQMDYSRADALIVRRGYTYDILGRPTARNLARYGTQTSDTFGYNTRSESPRGLGGGLDKHKVFAPKGRADNGVSASQLTSAHVNSADYTYAYDAIGNRTAAVENGTRTAYTANKLNQYTAEGSFRPTFDADGNQTLIKTSTGIWSVTYNAKNRPVLFTKSDGSIVVECTYDTMGRRATKKVTTNGTLTEHRRFLYRGYLQIACCDLTRAYTPALWFITWDPTQETATRPLTIQKNGTWYTYGWDLTKNICETYRTDGRIDLTYTYTPYGEVTPAHTYDQPLRWSSEYHDTELGLVYYNYRHYNPAMGRWMGRDSHPDGVNNYRFIYNALFAVDILGLKTQVFRWVGNWYDDEGGPGIGNYSDDVLFAHVDFKLELECGCYDIPYNHVPKDEEEGTKLVNSARYPFLVEYGADFHLQASNYDPITSKKTFVLKSRVTMAATLGYFFGIAVVSTGIGYGVGAVFAANSVIVGTSFLANVASGIAGAGLKRNVSATKILIIDVECPSGKNVMPRISYKVDPDSTAGSRESTTFGGRRKNELYLLDQIQWIN